MTFSSFSTGQPPTLLHPGKIDLQQTYHRHPLPQGSRSQPWVTETGLILAWHQDNFMNASDQSLCPVER